MFLLQAGIEIEAGLYVAAGGAAAIQISNSGVDITNNSDFNTASENVPFSACFFEAGGYAQAALNVELNLIAYKPKFEFSIAEVKYQFFELGSKIAYRLTTAQSDILLKDGTASFPAIYLCTYNLFTGENKTSELKLGKDTINIVVEDKGIGKIGVDGDYIIRDYNTFGGGEIYNIKIEYLDQLFKNKGCGADISFGILNLWRKDPQFTQREKEEFFIADELYLNVIKKPVDLESFGLQTADGKDTVEIASNTVLFVTDYAPADATFLDVSYSLKNPVPGVTLTDAGALIIDKAAPVGQIIHILATTIKNEGAQVSSELKLTIAAPKLNTILLQPYRASNMAPFNGKTLIPFGAEVFIGVYYNPANAIADIELRVLAGEEYIEKWLDWNVIKVVDWAPEDVYIAIDAVHNKGKKDEIRSMAMVLDVRKNLVNTVAISLPAKKDTPTVYRNEILNLTYIIAPSDVKIEGVYYRIGLGQNLASVDNAGRLRIFSDAAIGGTVEVIATVNGVDSEPLYLTVGEKYVTDLELTYGADRHRSAEMVYGQSIQLNAEVLPLDATFRDYEYEFLSGRECVELDSVNNIIFLKRNVDPESVIKFRLRKQNNDGSVVLSEIFTVRVKTTAIDNFYIFPDTEFILPGHAYRFDYSFSPDALNKNTTDYIKDYEFTIIKGSEFASFDYLGYLVIDQEIAQYNYEIIIKCTLITYHGSLSETLTLYYKTPVTYAEVSAPVTELMTSDYVDFSTDISPACAYITNIEYRINAGGEYGTITGSRLTVKHMNSAGKKIEVIAVITSEEADPGTGAVTVHTSVSEVYVITILNRPVTGVEFVSAPFVLKQGESFRLTARALPELATVNAAAYPIEYSLSDSRYASIGRDGLLTVYTDAEVGGQIEIIISSEGHEERWTVAIAKAQLDSFELNYTKPNIYIGAGDEITLNLFSPRPDYYEFELSLISFTVTGPAALDGYILRVDSNLNSGSDTLIKVTATINSYGKIITREIELEVTILYWTSTPESVERGATAEFTAGTKGFSNLGVEYYYYNPETGGLTSTLTVNNNQYGTKDTAGNIYTTNKFNIAKDCPGGTEFWVAAKAGQLIVVHRVTVKYISGFNVTSSVPGVSQHVSGYGNIMTYAILQYNYSMPSGGKDSIDLNVSATLSDGRTADSKSHISQTNYTVAEGSGYTQSPGAAMSTAFTVSLKANIDAGQRLIVKVTAENAAAKYIAMYPFCPAAEFGATGDRAISKIESAVEPEKISITSCSFANIMQPATAEAIILSNRSTNGITYSADKGKILNDGYWYAYNNYGQEYITITYSVSNTYLGRRFADDFRYPKSYYTEVRYLFNHDSVGEIRNYPSATYYVINDITLSGVWKPIPSFSGNIYGKEYTISNLNLSTYSVSGTGGGAYATQNYGLIAVNYGKIYDLKLSYSINVSGYDGGWVLAGAFAGENLGTISSCTAKATAGGANSYQVDLTSERSQSAVGGIAGKNGIGNGYDGTIINCTNFSHIWGTGDIGGIAGENYSGTISGCKNFGNIYYYYYKNNRSIGGIAGVQKNWGTITDCNNYGTIKYNNAQTQSESIQPHMGQVLGYNQGGTYSFGGCNGWVQQGTLYAYNYGLFGWSYHDQALYVSNNEVGRG